MRCCVCVSAKWTVSLGSVKSAGVDSGSPLIRSGNSQWQGVEQEVHSEGFFQDVVKSQIDPVVASAKPDILAVLVPDCGLWTKFQLCLYQRLGIT